MASFRILLLITLFNILHLSLSIIRSADLPTITMIKADPVPLQYFTATQIIKDLNYANATSSRFLHCLKDVLLLFLESDERATCSISAIAVKSTYNDPSNTPITVIAYNISMSTDDVPHTLTVLNNATLRGDLAFLLNLRGNYVITDITGPYTSTTILKPTLATAPTLSPTRDPTMRTPFKQAHTNCPTFKATQAPTLAFLKRPKDILTTVQTFHGLIYADATKPVFSAYLNDTIRYLSNVDCNVKIISITMETVKSATFRTNTVIPSRMIISYDIVVNSDNIESIKKSLNNAILDGSFSSQMNIRGGYVISSIKGNFIIPIITAQPTSSPLKIIKTDKIFDTVPSERSLNIPLIAGTCAASVFLLFTLFFFVITRNYYIELEKRRLLLAEGIELDRRIQHERVLSELSERMSRDIRERNQIVMISPSNVLLNV